MTGHSLRGRLVLPATLFFLTTLSLPWKKRPWIRVPGRPEGPQGSGLYCPYCYRTLQPRLDEGNILFCPYDGEISEADALESLPQQGP